MHFGRAGEGKASFKGLCRHCPLKGQCTPSRRGRTISVHPQEALLRRARAEQKSPEWQARYKSTRPIVERKIAHFTRRPWGGRKARVRGTKRVTTGVLTRAAALNWARLATFGLVFGDQGWSLSEPAPRPPQTAGLARWCGLPRRYGPGEAVFPGSRADFPWAAHRGLVTGAATG